MFNISMILLMKYFLFRIIRHFIMFEKKILSRERYIFIYFELMLFYHKDVLSYTSIISLTDFFYAVIYCRNGYVE